jgi:hypothetical protein
MAVPHPPARIGIRAPFDAWVCTTAHRFSFLLKSVSMSSSLYSCRPDTWAIVKVSTQDREPIYKILAGWYGGLLGGCSWRLNSGIAKVDDAGGSFAFHGYSGSIYLCSKAAYGTSRLSYSVYLGLAAKAALFDARLEILEEDSALSLEWFKSSARAQPQSRPH